MSGESDDGRVEGKKEIVAAGSRRDALEMTGKTGSEGGEVVREEVGDLLFRSGGGVDVHEGARE